MEQFTGEHTIAITIVDQPDTARLLSRFRDWFMAYPRAKVIVGAIENRLSDGREHWQIVAKCSVGFQAVNLAVLEAFPILKGVKSVKSKENRKSITAARKSFDDNVGYVLKGIPIGAEDSDRVMLKGISIEEIQRIPRSVLIEKNTSFIGRLSTIVRERLGTKPGYSREDVNRVLIEYFIEKNRIIPNKFRRGEYVTTIRLHLSGDEREYLIEDLIDETVY